MIHDFLQFLRYFRRAAHYVRGVLLVLLLVLATCMVLFMLTEGLEPGEAIYLTVITALSIGYGDIAPATTAGRMTSMFTGLIGMVVIGLTVAIANNALNQLAQEKRRNETAQSKT